MARVFYHHVLSALAPISRMHVCKTGYTKRNGATDGCRTTEVGIVCVTYMQRRLTLMLNFATVNRETHREEHAGSNAQGGAQIKNQVLY